MLLLYILLVAYKKYIWDIRCYSDTLKPVCVRHFSIEEMKEDKKVEKKDWKIKK